MTKELNAHIVKVLTIIKTEKIRVVENINVRTVNEDLPNILERG